MDVPKKPKNGPYPVEVKAGVSYRWCSCGLSENQPWCDDSHFGSGFEPVSFEAAVDGIFYMCGCKESDNQPYCFGNCTGHAENRWADPFGLAEK